jgi:hypothetical protein
MAEPGEAIIDKRRTAMLAPLFKAMGVPGFQAGGITSSFSGAVFPGLGTFTASDILNQINDFDNGFGSLLGTVLGDLAGAGGGSTAGNAANQALGKSLAGAYGWGTGAQWNDLLMLWSRESSWNNFAMNPSSGAYGIPQALPYTKMPQAAWPASAGGSSNAASQIEWGLGYIQGRYGSPAGAWSHEMGYGWYDQGGWLPTGASIAVNTTGAPEKVGGGPTVVQNFYGPQYPTPQQQKMMERDLVLLLGVAP